LPFSSSSNPRVIGGGDFAGFAVTWGREHTAVEQDVKGVWHRALLEERGRRLMTGLVADSGNAEQLVDTDRGKHREPTQAVDQGRRR
jgi:hypothetical protein